MSPLIQRVTYGMDLLSNLVLQVNEIYRFESPKPEVVIEPQKAIVDSPSPKCVSVNFWI